MAQPPFRSDAYEVENADAPAGPRLIEADENDGSLRFTDTRIPGGINLNELVGLQQAQNTIIVSQTGEGGSKDANGDPITTIQGALDNVPTSADVDDPWTIVLSPGLYVEDVYFLRDGTTITGLGNVIIRNASAVSTIRFRAGPATTPRRCKLQNLRIECVTAVEACVDLSSATFAVGTFTIASVPNVGDIADIDGTTLTAIANGSVPAPGEFELGTDEPTTAANLTDAINDPVNGLDTLVVATVSGSVVTIRALNDGVAGNAITISSTVPLIIVPSGATLTGGTASGPGSTLGDNLIEIVDCDLVPTVASGFTVRAAAVNNISVRGGEWREAASGTTFSINECAYTALIDQPHCGIVDMNYDSGVADLPAIATSAYELQNVNGALNGLTNGFPTGGAGSMTMTDCTFLGATVHSSDSSLRTFTATRCRFGSMTVGGLSPAVTLSNCTRGALVGGGTGTLAETSFYGSAVFAAVPVVTVLFPEPAPDTGYTVLLETPGPPAVLADLPFVPAAAKTTAGFDIAFGAPQALTVNFVVKRDI